MFENPTCPNTPIKKYEILQNTHQRLVNDREGTMKAAPQKDTSRSTTKAQECVD